MGACSLDGAPRTPGQRVYRTGKGHLRKDHEITASGYGIEHDLEVGRKVPAQITLALKGSQEDAHMDILVPGPGSAHVSRTDYPNAGMWQRGLATKATSSEFGNTYNFDWIWGSVHREHCDLQAPWALLTSL